MRTQGSAPATSGMIRRFNRDTVWLATGGSFGGREFRGARIGDSRAPTEGDASRPRFFAESRFRFTGERGCKHFQR
jgi:hypothetical protein